MPKRKTEVVDVPMLDFRAAPMPESLNEENRTVDFIASTGSRGLRRSWRGDYYEELEVSESAIRLGRLQNGAPFLNTHSSWDTSDVLGVVERAWIEKGNLMVTVRFSQRDEVGPIFQDIKDGILRHVSIGYMVYEYAVTEKEGELDVRVGVDWEPMEVSIVPMGFDDAAVARSHEKEVSQAKITYRAAVPTPKGEATMPTKRKKDDTPAAEQVTDKVETGVSEEEATRMAEEQATQAAADATTAERERITDIRAAVRKANLGDEFADALIEEGVPVDEARKRVLDAWGDQDDGAQTFGVRSGVDADIVASMRDGAVNALLHRASPEVELTEQGREFGNMNLLRLCEDLLQRQGVNVRALAPHEIASRALSTSDLANIAGAVFNRTLLQGYESTPRTFVGVFRQATGSDFRDMNRVRLSGAPALEEVKENGEFKYGKVTDEKETYSLATYGKILPFTRQTIINDDMDALSRVPMMFGRAAADLESDIVWGIVTANAALQDGDPLFHSNHGNLGTAGAVSETTLDEMEQKMLAQTGMEGRLINVRLRHLIVGPKQKLAAKKILTAVTPEQSSNVNVFQNTMDLVVEARLTGDAWYAAADFNQVDTIEYCFLEGNQGVYIETKQGFDVDGIAIKARHDFAAKAIDYRGLFKNAGA